MCICIPDYFVKTQCVLLSIKRVLWTEFEYVNTCSKDFVQFLQTLPTEEYKI